VIELRTALAGLFLRRGFDAVPAARAACGLDQNIAEGNFTRVRKDYDDPELSRVERGAAELSVETWLS